MEHRAGFLHECGARRSSAPARIAGLCWSRKCVTYVQSTLCNPRPGTCTMRTSTPFPWRFFFLLPRFNRDVFIRVNNRSATPINMRWPIYPRVKVGASVSIDATGCLQVVEHSHRLHDFVNFIVASMILTFPAYSLYLMFGMQSLYFDLLTGLFVLAFFSLLASLVFLWLFLSRRRLTVCPTSGTVHFWYGIGKHSFHLDVPISTAQLTRHEYTVIARGNVVFGGWCTILSCAGQSIVVFMSENRKRLITDERTLRTVIQREVVPSFSILCPI